jgi:hypothetical protein
VETFGAPGLLRFIGETDGVGLPLGRKWLFTVSLCPSQEQQPSWTDDLPLCHLSGVGSASNRSYSADGKGTESHPPEDNWLKFRCACWRCYPGWSMLVCKQEKAPPCHCCVGLTIHVTHGKWPLLWPLPHLIQPRACNRVEWGKDTQMGTRSPSSCL